jgi:glutathione S-transferase
MATTNEVTIAYWPIRGLSGVLRSTLAYCEVPFTEKLYTDFNEWFGKEKGELPVDFPNLPYLKDGSKVITESSSILQYIPIKAGKRELIGDTDDKFIQVQTALGAVGDVWTAVTRICWTKGDFEKEREELFTTGAAKSQLAKFDKILKDREWICGFLSVADFKLFETIDLVQDMNASYLEAYPNLIAFRNRFIELPKIKEFRASSLFKKNWFPKGMAAWTNE